MRRIQYLSTNTKQGHIFAALFAIILALAGFAQAASSHKGKKGSLKITSPTEVGGAILQPGDYEVREVNSPSGPVVEFVHLFDNVFATEGLPVHEQEIAAQVKYTVQALSSPPKHTQLLLTPNTKSASALEIHGNAVDYLFQQEQMNKLRDAMEVLGSRDIEAGSLKKSPKSEENEFVVVQ